MAQSYLVFSSLAAAQARSAQQAAANGCDGVLTKYWWQVGGGSTHESGIVPPDALSAVIITDGTFYGTQGLTGAELAALKLPTALTALGWAFPA